MIIAGPEEDEIRSYTSIFHLHIALELDGLEHGGSLVEDVGLHGDPGVPTGGDCMILSTEILDLS